MSLGSGMSVAIPLFLIGVVGLAGVKVPEGVSPWTFYGVCVLLALVFTTLAHYLAYPRKNLVTIALIVGLLTVILIIAAAVSIIRQMHPPL